MKNDEYQDFLELTYFENKKITSKSILSNNNFSNFISKSSKIKVEVLKENLANTINTVIDIFNSEKICEEHYAIDEIQIALNISIEGKVSILSTVSGGTNIQSGVIVKLKKNEV